MNEILSMSLQLSTEHSAFEPDSQMEIARILRELAKKIEEGELPQYLHDYNGNRCSKVSYELN